MTRIRLWLAGLLLGRLAAVSSLNRGQRYVVLYDERLLSQDSLRAIAKECGGGIFVPVRMDLLPDGSRIKDVLAFYPVGAKQ